MAIVRCPLVCYLNFRTLLSAVQSLSRIMCVLSCPSPRYLVHLCLLNCLLSLSTLPTQYHSFFMGDFLQTCR
ncbi:hypothetical protein J6590_082461 [Homalodisca vitripennis]|nr:hypothetical protein J6590_082461 [Homalodisca vitripennis]